MLGFLEHTLYPLVVACIATIVATPLSLIIIRKWGLLDDPAKRKHPALIHTKPIPRGGGIPIFIGFFIASLFFLPFVKITNAVVIATFLALVIGVLDDKYDISPYIRFIVNFVTAWIVVGSGVTIPFITNPLGGILHLDAFLFSSSILGFPLQFHIGDIVSIIWIVWVMNMLNWSKGVDGQMPGIVAISAFVIGVLSLRFGIVDENTLIASRLAFITAGCALGFLVFNFYPAKIFPGYGATCLYLLLAIVSILSSAKLATAILVMGIPMIDGVFTIVRRVITGHSPFWHDDKHLHHILLRFGMNQRQIAIIYWVFSILLGTISLFLTSTGKLFAILMLVVLAGGVLLTLHFLVGDREIHE